MKLLKIVSIGLGVIILILLGLLIFIKPANAPTASDGTGQSQTVTSPDGHLQISLPQTDAVVSSPLAIEGSVIGGGWFFEASFPIKILDGDGAILGTGKAQALGDWTSTGTVPFSASIVFAAPHYATGTILFANDNPSGLPANAKSFSMPISFENTMTSSTVVTGANSGTGTGTVKGHVVLGPSCPVETNPPNLQCAPKPYQTSIAISKNLETFQTFKTIQSDASGAFSVSLAPGEYDFQPQGGSVYPRCAEQLVTVASGKTNTITIACDTGIR